MRNWLLVGLIAAALRSSRASLAGLRYGEFYLAFLVHHHYFLALKAVHSILLQPKYASIVLGTC